MLVRAILQAVAAARVRRRGDQAGRASRPATLSDRLRAAGQRQRRRQRDACGRRP